MVERGYSFLLMTCSPSGKLVQIEYALAAAAGGALSVGIKAANGVVLATEKKQKSILCDEPGVDNVELITACPSGAYPAWKATAVGKNFISGKSFLEKRGNEDLELEDAIPPAILIPQESFEGQ
ncbi:hypothetical protein P7K49_032882 [Saguinus oedipus]|uniref:Proteasome alpha-type subunits domain-containing protein n=1 Tax=Saguinus oedipus TaxID=9490 RepID=A0ABQ9TQB7_SAGOE|nr:hypothetical protein P7K49_032882 [Saguinus oedipus]